MVIQINQHYWEISLQNPEEFFEEYYIKEGVIISDPAVLKLINSLRRSITSYCYLKNKEGDAFEEVRQELLGEISNMLMLKIKGKCYIHHSDFVAFWKVLDYTFSMYNSIKDNDRKLNILRNLIEEYCDKREDLYMTMGYSDTTIQVLYDNGASRRKASGGVNKILDIIKPVFKNRNIQILEATTSSDFSEQIFIFHKMALFKQFLDYFNIDYSFGRSHQDKNPDIVIKIHDDLFIMELKHVKEGGGGQDGTITELIQFIEQQEVSGNIHYISFMDGGYINLFVNPSSNTSASRQKSRIEEVLRNSPQNYFCNTKGFINLLNDCLQTLTL